MEYICYRRSDKTYDLWHCKHHWLIWLLEKALEKEGRYSYVVSNNERRKSRPFNCYTSDGISMIHVCWFARLTRSFSINHLAPPPRSQPAVQPLAHSCSVLRSVLFKFSFLLVEEVVYIIRRNTIILLFVFLQLQQYELTLSLLLLL